MSDRAWPGGRRLRPAVAGVLAVTLLGLVARLWALGWRTAHWDESRVALRIVEYLSTGEYTYRPIVHGPFLFQVNYRVFGAVGASDFTARLVVALVGGLLPLAALLFRARLRDVEVVALAGFLAANPVLLYYSRVMRNDVLVGAFAVVALGFAVRAIDARDPRYLYAAGPALALAFTAKENALVYVGCWVGALALTLDHRLRARRAAGAPGDDVEADTAADGGAVARYRWQDDLVAELRRGAVAVWRWRGPVVVAALEFLFVVVLFFAPRPALWQALGDPTRLPGVVGAATVGSWESFWGTWVTGGHQSHPYLPYFEDYVATLGAGALVVMAFSVVGFVADRYAGDGPRDLVAFAGYWGFASLFVYPLATDISPAPWSAVHTVLPIAIPAAVGVGLVYRRGARAFLGDDRVGAAAAALLLVVSGIWVGVAAADHVYRHPQDPGPLVQYGQPDDDLKPVLGTVERVVRAHDGGPDVLFYGAHFANRLYRLPLPWYLATYDAEVAQEGDFRKFEDGEPPGGAPVVVAPAEGSARIDQTAADVRDRLEGYREFGPLAITLEIPGNEVWIVVFVDEEYLAGSAAPATAGPATARPPTAVAG